MIQLYNVWINIEHPVYAITRQEPEGARSTTVVELSQAEADRFEKAMQEWRDVQQMIASRIRPARQH